HLLDRDAPAFVRDAGAVFAAADDAVRRLPVVAAVMHALRLRRINGYLQRRAGFVAVAVRLRQITADPDRPGAGIQVAVFYPLLGFFLGLLKRGGRNPEGRAFPSDFVFPSMSVHHVASRRITSGTVSSTCPRIFSRRALSSSSTWISQPRTGPITL